jgi:RHH-type proline utilization regulon transcriptional repressor/proline dehydrogenase/delta 1-pyrroline-5-carboxylate dehydrogenase
MNLETLLNPLYRAKEEDVVASLLSQFRIHKLQSDRIQKRAQQLIVQIRQSQKAGSFFDEFIKKHPLTSPQGRVLMELAESFLRIPDRSTANALIEDKFQDMNLATFMPFEHSKRGHFLTFIQAVLEKAFNSKLSKPLVRAGVTEIMKIIAQKFVMGLHIEDALKNRSPDYCYSFDMLGEAALTQEDAQRSFYTYLQAIHVLQKRDASNEELSIKLSALHPRYQYTQQDRVLAELIQSLKTLAKACQESQINFIIDAEESECLELSLRLFEKLARAPELQTYQGLGIAVQAYQKRATAVIDWLIWLAQDCQKKFRVRRVKGAYWDSEIKWAQEKGLKDYAVFTRRKATDLSYMVCAQKMLAHPQEIYSAFATHNAYTVSWIIEHAGEQAFEFQRLYGMGEALYESLLNTSQIKTPIRIYAPVGPYQALLPYLVRRLLENGSNSSFVNALIDSKKSIKNLTEDPVASLRHTPELRHPKIPLPSDLYKPRRNSKGLDLSNKSETTPIMDKIMNPIDSIGAPIINGLLKRQNPRTAYSPINQCSIGQVSEATENDIETALSSAQRSFVSWRDLSVEERAKILEQSASTLEKHQKEFVALCVYEGGKTIPDALSEIREAVDYCRYYAQQARLLLSTPTVLPSPTGEENTLSLKGRGVFLCISPWNFPLAIFIGQLAAALVTGNCVLAKSSSQTVMTACKAVQLMHQAGVPKEVLHFIPSPGEVIGSILLSDPRIAGVCLTGSMETAWEINRQLSKRRSAIIPFIAETGGQNAMIVDSSALPEQVVKDAVTSAFNSAGQRCSSLRLLLLQEECAPVIIKMLQGAMAELHVGDPRDLSTDVGPLIDESARKKVSAYVENLSKTADLLFQVSMKDPITSQGPYFSPCAYLIHAFDTLQEEHFGPVLHVMTYKNTELDHFMEKINKLGFGLTFGLQTRLHSRIKNISKKMEVGNIYVNRNMIGAVVGVQPFGGQGLSGTGPKAGGPHYLHRFLTEQTLSINTTAQGGNATLMILGEEA